MSRIFRWAALAGLAGIFFMAGCSSSGTASSASAAGGGTSSPAAGGSSADTIVIRNFMFSPMSLTVAPGTKVTVRNEDSVAHTLTGKSSSTAFSTGDIGPGQSKTISAPNKAGRYSYICSIHQYMTGTIVVR